MEIVIVGGGKLGLDLAETLIEGRHHVVLIEIHKERCIAVADQLNAEVICGDGTEIETLEEAGVKHCDIFIAVTGRDQDNLVATQLAKREFGAKKVIARSNNPVNTEMLRKLGTDVVISSTELIAQIIEQRIGQDEIELLATLNKGRASIVTYHLPQDTALSGKMLKDLTLPEGSLIISIVREDDMMIPHGKTKFQGGDEVVAVCENTSRQDLLALLGKR